MSDETRIRAMELRLQAERVEEWVDRYGDIPDDDPWAVSLQAPASAEEIRLLEDQVRAQEALERAATSRARYVAHLAHPDCGCGLDVASPARWQFCPLARQEGFR